jgi:hypothetical protein
MKPEAPARRAKVHRWSDYGRLGQCRQFSTGFSLTARWKLSPGSGPAVNASNLIDR